MFMTDVIRMIRIVAVGLVLSAFSGCAGSSSEYPKLADYLSESDEYWQPDESLSVDVADDRVSSADEYGQSNESVPVDAVDETTVSYTVADASPPPEAILQAQRMLAALGYDPGPADGVWNPRTVAAYRSFLRDAGLPVSDTLTTEAFLEMQALADLGGIAEPVVEEIYEVGQKFRDCEECPQMVVVPAGSYEMGSPAWEEERYESEGPQHWVEIADPLAVGVYEVTRGEWSRFAGATEYRTQDGCRIYEDGNWQDRSGRSWRNPGYAQTDWHPVACVDWQDAKAYVDWLSDKTGHDYRLLSESEWEYVARAGTTTPFHYGETISPEQANYDANDTYGSGRTGIYRGKTLPVGSFPANAFGLHDVHGNVGEWVEDCWHDDYRGAPSDGSAWVRGGDCDLRVVRGGSWSTWPRDLRSASRSLEYTTDYATYSRNSYDGFRVARTLAP